MLLIATDEAGYGPKLGPLVIAATAWRLPVDSIDQAELDALFVGLRTPQVCNGVPVVIDDSKAVYKSGDALRSLHAAVSASHHWCGTTETTLSALLPRLASEDVISVGLAPWLDQLSDERFLDAATTAEIRATWRQTGIEQLDTKARILTAASFNRACGADKNKAELLSESTLGLARTLLEAHGRGIPKVAMFCDRHGGRRYYGGLLQHVFPEAMVQVVSESSQQSIYRLTTTDSETETQSVTVHFTVKGDSFTPVSLSSIHAKYLRERLMESFNQYFRQRHHGDAPLKPTAGYPVDADRFLCQIATIIEREKIPAEQLIRSR